MRARTRIAMPVRYSGKGGGDESGLEEDDEEEDVAVGALAELKVEIRMPIVTRMTPDIWRGEYLEREKFESVTNLRPTRDISVTLTATLNTMNITVPYCRVKHRPETSSEVVGSGTSPHLFPKNAQLMTMLTNSDPDLKMI